MLRRLAAIRLRYVPAVLGCLVMVVGIVLGPTGLLLWPYQTLSLARPGALVLLAVVGAVVASAHGYRNVPFRISTVVMSVAGCGLGLLFVVPAVEDGLLAPAMTTAVVGALLAVAGTVLLAVEPVLPRVRLGRVRDRVVLGAAVVGVVALVVTATAWARSPRTSVSDVPVSDLPVVAAPGIVGWRWQANARVGQVAPIAGGVVLDRDTEDGDETVALDGARGAVRWTFIHPGVEFSVQDVSPDGGTVVISQTIPTKSRSLGHPDLLSVVDARTGEVRAEVAAGGTLVDVTDDVLVVREPRTDLSQETLVAYDLRDGSHRWDWSPTDESDIRPGDCLGMRATSESPLDLRLPTTVLAWSDCRPEDGSRGLERRIVGLDGRTGDERWRFGPVPVTTLPPTVGAVPGSDVVGIGGLSPRFLDGATGVPVSAPPVAWPPREYDSTAGIPAPGAFVTVERPVVGGSTVVGSRG
ncbi:hypothetical protein [Actinomycetospora termitidis]|uniref:Uncharacterized protein n=1 Tax=Actinomycetospora termitidis TaxID=3053470 RepID=A0ABT7M6D6_9PSEU|nr:hypothetical protein [Actinomycetospora sp. Odt1-22]MDL5156093.1 hypothetical protein [Actinomycetospora sp. Odt1-22]